MFGENSFFKKRPTAEDPHPMEEDEEGLIIQPEPGSEQALSAESAAAQADLEKQLSDGEPIIDRDPPPDGAIEIEPEEEREVGA